MVKRDREVQNNRESRLSRRIRQRELAKEQRAKRRAAQTRRIGRIRSTRSESPAIKGVTPEQIVPAHDYHPGITVVMVNHNTNHLMSTAIMSMRRAYPSVQLLVVDNSSKDGSVDHLVQLGSRSFRFILLDENKGHGPALHLGILACSTRFVFTLDTDTEVLKGGFFEELVHMFNQDEELFAAGWLRYVNFNGVPFPNQENQNGYRYIHPCAMMLDREKYLLVEPFVNKGAPAIRTMISAARNLFHLVDYPILDYIDHLGAGTRRLYGGNWDPQYINRREPGQWNPNDRYRV